MSKTRKPRKARKPIKVEYYDHRVSQQTIQDFHGLPTLEDFDDIPDATPFTPLEGFKAIQDSLKNGDNY